MAFTIEGYTVDELIKLGKEVEVVGSISISGDAKKVGQTFMALGMFAQLACELKNVTSGYLISSDDELDNTNCAFIQATWPNNENGQCTVSLPTLTFRDAKNWLPRNHQVGGVERKYLVRWKDESGASGEALCVFTKDFFWSCGQGLTAKLDVLNNDKIQVEWCPLF